jgi:hypothetical protein
MKHFLGKRMARPIALVAALLSLALALGTPFTANAAVRTPSHLVAHSAAGTMHSYVHGTGSGGHRIVGSFTPHRFVVRNGHLKAIGKLDVVSRGPGRDRHAVRYGVVMPVHKATVSDVRYFAAGGKGMPAAAALGSCDILNLVLGPLDLNLLGLKVHLDKVVLNITAIAGAGNLLGNLLCAVAGLLDGSGILGQLSTLLNQILAVLNL